MPKPLRFATFNVAMSADVPGEIYQQLKRHPSRFQRIAAIIQHCNPDVLLLCEFDHPGAGGDDGMLAYFQRHFLEVSQSGLPPVFYPHALLPPSNTGLARLPGQEVENKPDKAQGFGCYHGQYGFVLLSKYPIDTAGLRSWQTLLWQGFRDSQMPQGFYADDDCVQRLSSKNHVAVPVIVGDNIVTVVACHPTPPVFDGPEKRNFRRNADEIRLLRDIVEDHPQLRDDSGLPGGVSAEMPLVVMGDLNADPVNGAGDKTVIRDLLNSDRLQPVAAKSAGATQCLRRRAIRAKNKATHNRGLRLDYVLPSAHFTFTDCGVFWPAMQDPLSHLLYDANGKPSSAHSSDHRLVWVDIAL